MDLPPGSGSVIAAGEESIGRRLARIRKERGLTQIELAEKIGIIQSLVSSYENDVLNASAKARSDQQMKETDFDDQRR